jgi:purine-nucleoside phosphorylase
MGAYRGAVIDPDAEPWSAAEAAGAGLASKLGGGTFDVALVLGSGWAPAADELGTTTAEARATNELGFPRPTVDGHASTVLAVDVAGRRVLVFLGRVHAYEGHSAAVVVHGVRAAVAAGCRVVVLTNAAGSLRADLAVGEPVVIADHLNLTGRSPLTGAEPPAPRALRFCDLTDLYAARLRALVPDDVPTGVYAGLSGPHYETPAEIRMLRTLGADLVGMSTVLEAIAARHAGAEVLGISLVTNAAAGVDGGPLDHADVLAAGRTASGRVGALLRDVIGRL